MYSTEIVINICSDDIRVFSLNPRLKEWCCFEESEGNNIFHPFSGTAEVESFLKAVPQSC